MQPGVMSIIAVFCFWGSHGWATVWCQSVGTVYCAISRPSHTNAAHREGILAYMWPCLLILCIWKSFRAPPAFFFSNHSSLFSFFRLLQIHSDCGAIILWHESDTWYACSKLLSFPILWRTEEPQRAGEGDAKTSSAGTALFLCEGGVAPPIGTHTLSTLKYITGQVTLSSTLLLPLLSLSYIVQTAPESRPRLPNWSQSPAVNLWPSSKGQSHHAE